MGFFWENQFFSFFGCLPQLFLTSKTLLGTWNPKKSLGWLSYFTLPGGVLRLLRLSNSTSFVAGQLLFKIKLAWAIYSFYKYHYLKIMWQISAWRYQTVHSNTRWGEACLLCQLLQIEYLEIFISYLYRSLKYFWHNSY